MHTASWLEALSYGDSLSFLRGLAIRSAKLGGAVGREILSLLEKEDYASVCNYVIDYEMDWDVIQLIECRQALAYFQKWEPLKLGLDKSQVAREKYVESEKRCSLFNVKLRKQRMNHHFGEHNEHIFEARAKIRRLLGAVPSLSDLKLRFGPGSTSTIKRKEASIQNKLAEAPTCSYELLRSSYMPILLNELYAWQSCHAWCARSEGRTGGITAVTGQLQFVPKNAKTYRTIDVQPTLNTLLQSGIGDYMADRLRLAGINTRDQTINQRRAREGSLDGSLATLDLSAASDTISREIVRCLLPDNWFYLLNSAACSLTTDREAGTTHSLEKFSSMGNGFTFPLETLIFWALTASACEGEVDKVSVYGDDIICPIARVDTVISLLEHCGFVINRDKSFVSGPFRESCGRDYYKGIDVRPVYVKSDVTCETLFILHNYFYRHHQFDVAEFIRNEIPVDLRLYGPDGYGDGHLLGKHEEIRVRKQLRAGYRGYSFETYTRIGCKIPSIYPGDYVSPLYSVYIRVLSGHPLDEPTSPIEFAKWQALQACPWIDEPTSPVEFTRSGRPCWPAPGDNGYKKTLIYTLG